MKKLITLPKIRNLNGKKVAICFCGAQFLLRFQNPEFYHAGVYGWNFDVYTFDDYVICTGYRSMIGKYPDCELLKMYEKEAQKVCENYSLSYEDKAFKVNNLLSAFLESI